MSGSATKPACRSTSPTTRCTRSPSAPASAWRSSRPCSRCSSPSHATSRRPPQPGEPRRPAHPPAACPAGGVVTDPGDAGLPRRLVAWLGDEHLLQGLELLHALAGADGDRVQRLSLIHISEPTRLGMISY